MEINKIIYKNNNIKHIIFMSKNLIENVDDDFKSKYFPFVKNINYSDIMVTTEGKYSISDNSSSDILVELIGKYFKSKNLIITDGTGNNGSDTIALALVFKTINSIELDETNFKALENNVKQVYKLSNVNLYKGSSLDFFKKKYQDVIYLDAPWGGTQYKENSRIELYMDGKDLGQIYNENKKYTKLFIFKLPKNYDFTNFIQKTMITKYYMYLYTKNNKPKFFFMFVPCKNKHS
jgi:16S rRNA G966 N2-methylase RsmD